MSAPVLKGREKAAMLNAGTSLYSTASRLTLQTNRQCVFSRAVRGQLRTLNLRASDTNRISSTSPELPTVHAMSSAASNGSQPTPAAAIDFLMLLQQLKLTKRTGWVRKNVSDPESIADHMYRMSMMALIATDSNVDVTRCIKMSMVHDVAEAIVGDITPHCGVSDEDKHQRELRAVGRIQEMLGRDTEAAREVESLWHEYEAASSPEALLVKDFDKLEMIITAHQYEQAQPGLLLEEFFTSTSGRFKTETGKAWAAELISRRCKAQSQAKEAAAGAGATAAAAQAAGPRPSAAETDGVGAEGPGKRPDLQPRSPPHGGQAAPEEPDSKRSRTS